VGLCFHLLEPQVFIDYLGLLSQLLSIVLL
jgi:hypothetical protein